MINTIETDKIEYLNVQILKAEINNPAKTPLQKGDDFVLSFLFKAIDLYNIDKNLIRVILYADIIVMKDGHELNAGAKFEIDNYFRYLDLKKFTRVENDKVLVESEFADIVKGLTYSTARGIIYSKLAGTFLEGTILPVKMITDIKNS